ncbi:ribosome small subunit-dependent GTPase A [Halalkalibacillus sediminis]|uniref:Small ribosomal subunit biogenesis GTPase RsgA n=1 Tax=Halalkalibacillus sediminis TaxID=2018042 RepID=A0A2I0QW84_9BACI|nr:ribosome small subunit-dependent GTPase A [Halalkalibacillus sediminis]PKR78574.1 ribosome small subunit-dependent GTPase A [Halalkalibacillus sediminis]
MIQGKIVKALSGFYYVMAENETYTCKGRGLFRKQKVSPLVGDIVEFELDPDSQSGTIQKIHDRSNELVRPPVANVDQAIIVSSMIEPPLNPLLLNRFLVLVEHKEIEPLLLFTKGDLADKEVQDSCKEYAKAYEKAGYRTLMIPNENDAFAEQIRPYLNDRISVIAGQSGVGKSTILNRLKPELNLETNDISKSLGRGKHTTRHVELHPVFEGYIADTPGFSSLEFDGIELEDLRECFPEFVDREEGCKFRGCFHVNEPKCAVKAAVEQGEIQAFRYEHYLDFYEEIKNRKPRY